MQELLQRRGIRQFVKFAVVGTSSFIIDAGVYFIETRFLGIYYIVAKGISFLISVANSYTWNRKWTFRSENKQKGQEFAKFLVVAGIGFSLNLGIMYLAVAVLGWRDYYGLLLATAVVTFWNFTINKFWVFKRTSPIIIE